MEGGGSCSLNSRLQHIQIRLHRVRTWWPCPCHPHMLCHFGSWAHTARPWPCLDRIGPKKPPGKPKYPSAWGQPCAGVLSARSSKGEGTGSLAAARRMDALAPLMLPGLGIWWLKVAAPAAAWHSPNTGSIAGLQAQPALHRHGHGWAQAPSSSATPLCCWVLHLGSPQPPVPPRAAAGLSCGRRGGSQGCTQPHTLPGAAAAARRELQRGGPPPSPLQKQLKMKHTQLHNSAQIRSQHTRQRRPRPPPPALEMPPDLPSIPAPLTHASPGILPPKN